MTHTCQCDGMDNQHTGCLIHDQELIEKRCLEASPEELKRLQRLNLTFAFPRDYDVNPYIRNGKIIWLCGQCQGPDDSEFNPHLVRQQQTVQDEDYYN